jgi:hypothetical protein
MKRVPIFNQNIKSLLPKKLYLSSSNGNFELSLLECEMIPPKVQIIYQHSTPDETGDVLTDGEPDYIGIDIHVVNSEGRWSLNIDITYGDAMMFSFKILPTGKVEVGHYNGHGSMADPDYEFYFQEESIKDLMEFFQKFDFGFKLSRDQFNFLDGDKNSFKVEKVSHHRIANFSDFNLRGRL